MNCNYMARTIITHRDNYFRHVDNVYLRRIAYKNTMLLWKLTFINFRIRGLLSDILQIVSFSYHIHFALMQHNSKLPFQLI